MFPAEVMVTNLFTKPIKSNALYPLDDTIMNFSNYQSIDLKYMMKGQEQAKVNEK